MYSARISDVRFLVSDVIDQNGRGEGEQEPGDISDLSLSRPPILSGPRILLGRTVPKFLEARELGEVRFFVYHTWRALSAGFVRRASQYEVLALSVARSGLPARTRV